MRVRPALVILTVFAAAWSWGGLWLSGAAPSLVIFPIATSLVLLAWGWRGSGVSQSRGPHVRKVVGLWSSVEVVALLVTANVLQNLHRADLMLPLGAIIVGLHFFPLARGIPVRIYYASGAGLVLAGAAGLIVPPAQRPMVAGMVAALTLWATALVIVLRARRATTACD
jgi:hypothetical protein